MNYVSLAMWLLTALSIVLGIVFGAIRGTSRSFIRIILVLLCAVGAFFLKDVIVDLVLKMKIGGKTMQEIFMGILPEQAASLNSEVILPLIKILAGLVLFVLLFYALRFVTWAIVFPLIKLALKKNGKKHRVGGVLIGLIQGAVVALVVCIPLAGMLAQTNKVYAMVQDMESESSSSSSAMLDESGLLYEEETPGEGESEGTETPGEGESEGSETPGEGEESKTPGESEGGESGSGESGSGETQTSGDSKESTYPDGFFGKILSGSEKFEKSFLGKFYTKTLNKPFKWLTTTKVKVTDSDGKTTTKKISLENQIDAIQGAIDFFKGFKSFKDIDFSGEFTSDTAQQIKDIFDSLGQTKDNLSQESIDTINTIANTMLGNVGLPAEVNIEDFDLNEVDFAKEGQLVVDVTALTDKETITADDMKTIVDDLSESNLVRPILEGAANGVTLSSDQKDQLETALNDDKLAECDQDTIDMLRDLFGLSASTTPEEEAVE